jgi:hypothetical protein
VAAEAWVAALCAGMLTGLKPLSMTEKHNVRFLKKRNAAVLSQDGDVFLAKANTAKPKCVSFIYTRDFTTTCVAMHEKHICLIV